MSNNPNIQVPDLKYKTELCRTWVEQNYCPYMEKCRFAHGKNDLQDKIIFGKNYKQKDCKSFHSKGFCPYGPRCLFRHDERKFSDLNRPFYKYVLESNFPNLYFANLNSNKSRKNSQEEDLSNSMDNDKCLNLKIKESSNANNTISKCNSNNFGVKAEQNSFENINDKKGFLKELSSENSQETKKSELENSTQDYSSFCNYSSERTKFYRPRLSVFERFRAQTDSNSFESTDIDIEFDNSEVNLNNDNEVGNFSIENKLKSKCNHNYNLSLNGLSSNFNCANNLNAISNNAKSRSNGACNFSYFDKPSDKNIKIGKGNLNDYTNNNMAVNCQNNFPILNNHNLKNSTRNNNYYNNYNNNLINSLAANMKTNAHLQYGKVPTTYFINNNNKNKFSVPNPNLFAPNSISIPNKIINAINKLTIQRIKNKNKYNLNNGSIANNNNYNIIGKNISDINQNSWKNTNSKNALNTLSANHQPFYPSPKNKNQSLQKNANYFPNDNINKYFGKDEDKNNSFNSKPNNNNNNFCYSDNYQQIFSNSNENFDFFGEISSPQKADNQSNTSILSTDNSHFKESIPNSFLNEIENLNNFPKENFNFNNDLFSTAKNSQKNLNLNKRNNENSQSDSFCFEDTKQNFFSSNALDEFQKGMIEGYFSSD